MCYATKEILNSLLDQTKENWYAENKVLTEEMLWYAFWVISETDIVAYRCAVLQSKASLVFIRSYEMNAKIKVLNQDERKLWQTDTPTDRRTRLT